MEAVELYRYQAEVVQRALQGENLIIWLPTGGGKTRAAVFVAQKHLEKTPNAKVLVLVNTVHLVNQHFSREFQPHLGRRFSVLAVSGDSEEKDFFGVAVRNRDVVICTAQIFLNALMSQDEDKQTRLSDFTLLIVDECHHTHKESVYNQVMRRYLDRKLRGEERPQVLGLTASPGTGGARTLDRAVEHILQICANLDSTIASCQNFQSELKEQVPRPVKVYEIVEKRPEDPFGDLLKAMMVQIQDWMNLEDFSPGPLGSQEYDAELAALKQRGIREKNRRTTRCADHLRAINDSLLINDTLRMIDAYRALEDFLNSSPALDGTDRFLLGLFQENREKLKEQVATPRFENPKMLRLERVLLEQFGSGVPSKGILFSRTRRSTHYLQDWVLGNAALQQAGVRSAVLTGAGSAPCCMTQNQQQDTLDRFRNDELNLLIATSVAEEGLDVPECNLVLRYGLLTNDIAQQQASGRARAKDSRYAVVAQRGAAEVHKEQVNEDLERLCRDAIALVQDMDPLELQDKLVALQRDSLCSSQQKQRLTAEKKSRNLPSDVLLLCQNCFTPVANGNDIRVIDSTHYVNVSRQFQEHYSAGPAVTLAKRFEDWEPGCRVQCKHCTTEWGFEIKYKKKAVLPNLAVRRFVLESPEGRTAVKKWKDVPFSVQSFTFEEYCQELYSDLLD